MEKSKLINIKSFIKQQQQSLLLMLLLFIIPVSLIANNDEQSDHSSIYISIPTFGTINHGDIPLNNITKGSNPLNLASVNIRTNVCSKQFYLSYSSYIPDLKQSPHIFIIGRSFSLSESKNDFSINVGVGNTIADIDDLTSIGFHLFTEYSHLSKIKPSGQLKLLIERPINKNFSCGISLENTLISHWAITKDDKSAILMITRLSLLNVEFSIKL